MRWAILSVVGVCTHNRGDRHHCPVDGGRVEGHGTAGTFVSVSRLGRVAHYTVLERVDPRALPRLFERDLQPPDARKPVREQHDVHKRFDEGEAAIVDGNLGLPALEEPRRAQLRVKAHCKHMLTLQALYCA